MDLILIIELCIVAVIVALQIWIVNRNRKAIQTLETIYPETNQLRLISATEVDEEEDTTGVSDTIELVEEDPGFNETFLSILRTTNTYIRRNRGEADFEILKELAERKLTSHEQRIESSIALPLYIGLLCTFTGVIIGLIKIASVGVTDAAIQSFLGGVLIGMIGSAVGLGLTVLSNQWLKNAKGIRDQRQYGYFHFLQTFLLSPLQKDGLPALTNLKQSLTAFHDGFVVYQKHMNESLGETLHLFSDLQQVFTQIRSLERGLHGMGHFLQANDGLIEKHLAYISTYTRKVDEFAKKLNTHFGLVNHQDYLTPTSVNGTSNGHAYAGHQQNGHGSGMFATITETERYAYAEALNKDLSQIRGDIEYLQAMSLEVNTRLLDKLKQEAVHQQEMSAKFREISHRLDDVMGRQENSVLHSPAFKFFIYIGAAAFMIGIVSGGIYLINTLAS
ncbi:MAG: hypothetical protein AAF587_17400 [Bacteroidota bacterium]